MTLPTLEINLNPRRGRGWYGSLIATMEAAGANASFTYIEQARDDILAWYKALSEEQRNMVLSHLISDIPDFEDGFDFFEDNSGG